MLHVEAASSIVAKFPDRLLLLGIPADESETQYGWIQPALPLDFAPMGGPKGIGPAFHIRRFWEKPLRDLAAEFCRQGFFWNSFVIVARIAALLDLFTRALPQLYVSFAQSFPVFGTTREREAVARLFDDIQLFSFSDDVLTKFCTEFLVLPVRNIQWSDLGKPTRVLKIITQTGLRPKWLDA
jgi:mannose-1-phosphate guanylyltransferase